jgi:hypothetical protein
MFIEGRFYKFMTIVVLDFDHIDKPRPMVHAFEVFKLLDGTITLVRVKGKDSRVFHKAN